MKKNKQFTLIELLITLAIISLLSSIFGINVYTFVQEYRFEQSCSSIATELFATGRIAHVQQGTVEIHFELSEKGLLLRRTTDEAIPVDKQFFQFTKQYKGIDQLEIDGVKKNKYTLRFTPAGIREKEVVVKYREKFHKIPLHLL